SAKIDAQTRQESIAAHKQAVEADTEQKFVAAFWLYRQAAQQMSEALAERPELKHFVTDGGLAAVELLRISTSRALELHRELKIEATSSRLADTAGWVSALIVGPTAATDLVIAAAMADCPDGVAETADISAAISIATVESERCSRMGRLLMSELMQRLGLLCLRQLDCLFNSDSVISSELRTELLVRVHALRSAAGASGRSSGVRVSRSRILATAASADAIPSSARRRLFDLQLSC
uniref:NIT domain-containing protein n=1 Tax=Macrostomum lignano TaxID=282301 RepID=A0A1I8J6I4_9PLAT